MHSFPYIKKIVVKSNSKPKCNNLKQAGKIAPNKPMAYMDYFNWLSQNRSVILSAAVLN